MRATDRASEVSFLVGISRHRAYLPRRNGTSIRPSPFFTDSKVDPAGSVPTTWLPRHDKVGHRLDVLQGRAEKR